MALLEICLDPDIGSGDQREHRRGCRDVAAHLQLLHARDDAVAGSKHRDIRQIEFGAIEYRPGLLHGGVLHIAMNMVALFSLGSLVERLAGPWRMAGLYLAAALAAGFASALLNPPTQPSLGASGAILGLAGVLLAPRWRRDPRFPQGLALRLHQWLARSMAFLFGLGLLFALLDLPVQFDNAAHFGGLLCGFAIGYLWPSFLVRSGPWTG